MKNTKIYRRVNGELIEIMKCDLSKRYHQTTNAKTGKTVIIEFTKEEEDEWDKKDVEWEAGREQREADKQEQDKKEKERISKLVKECAYEECYVLFLDVLGWKTATVRASTDPKYHQGVVELMDVFANFADYISKQGEELNGEGVGAIRASAFSDSMIISGPATDSMIHRYIAYLGASLFEKFMHRGFLLRGGFSRGLAFHKDNYIAGPAFNEAYRLESQEADGCQILMAAELTPEIGIGPLLLDQDKQPLGYQKVWRFDHRGRLFLDALQPLISMSHVEPNIPYMTEKLMKAKELAINGMNVYETNQSIRSKYIWLAGYVNDMLDEYPKVEVKKIYNFAEK